MTERLRVGVIGGGLIAQVEHIPNLITLSSQYDLRVVSDPSSTVREGVSRRFGIATVPDAADLLGYELDAVVIAAPDPWHARLARQAMQAGLHVFCEKPLCYGLDELDELAAAQRQAGVVLQVGYMKRFDPSYQAALDLIAGKGEMLRFLSVEVHDPDAWPFVAHHPLVTAQDDLSALASETAGVRQAQVAAALGFVPIEPVFRGFVGAYCSALVHDVNLVHGLLDRIGLEPGAVLGAALFANGAGGQASIDLCNQQALWTMAYAEIPKVGDYSERVSLYFEDEIVELVFPAPYLNHHPTRLVHKRSIGGRLETTAIRSSFEAPFVREIDHFWRAIVRAETPRNTVADARRDQRLLIEMARKANETFADRRPKNDQVAPPSLSRESVERRGLNAETG